MSKKRAPQAELSHNTRLFIDPCNMVVLQAADGETFLVEKNCAMVSKRFREALLELEGTLTAAAQAVDDSSGDTAHTSPVTVPSAAAANASSFKERAAVDLERRIPFYDIEWERRPDASDKGRSLYSIGEIVQYRHKQNLERLAPMDTPPTTSGKNSGRTPVVVPTGVRRPYLSVIEDDDGVKRYPLFDFPDVKADLLEVAIRFMYLKYRLDSEPEKRQTFHTGLLGESSPVRLIAISAILGM